MANSDAATATNAGMRSLIGGLPPFKRGFVNSRFLLKLCCGLSLLVILVVWFDVSKIVNQLIAIDQRFLAIAITFFVLQYALSCVRWVYILDRQRFEIGSRNALSIFGIGTLANLFLVTSIAGMSVRAALLVKSGMGMSKSLASVTVERMAAALGLALCAAAGLVAAFPELRRFVGQGHGDEADFTLALSPRWVSHALPQCSGISRQ